MKTIHISDEVKDVLKQAEFSPDRVKLMGQLPRDKYAAVMKVLEAQGGKWSRKDGCHLFPTDPRQIFEDALESGAIVHRKKTTQAFYTPLPIVKTVLVFAMPKNGMRVLEPSAGDGRFADALRAKGCDVTCVESDEASVKILAGKQHEVLGVDFLALGYEGFAFDMVVMNPPFTKGQDVAHVTHALKFLKPGGQCWAIMAASFEFNAQAKYKAFRSLMESSGRVVERFDNHEFRESGTDISTRLICLTA